MHCSSPEHFPGMLLVAGCGSYQAARAGLKLANSLLCLVLPGESLRLDLNSCKTHLTSVEFHSGILFRKNLESSIHPWLGKSREVVNHLYVVVSNTYASAKDMWSRNFMTICFVESVQAWSSLLKCFTITFESSLNFFCTVAVISLGISKCICISEEEAGSTWLPWEERRRIVSG